MKTMNARLLILAMMAATCVFIGACGTSRNSNQPWDRPTAEDNDRGYNTPDPFPMDRGNKGTNSY